jgi:hypothetical protein
MSHPLDGCRAKIERAKEHIRNLDPEITTLIDSTEHTVTVHTYYDARVTGFSRDLMINGPPIPDRIRIIIGEIVHQLRSSLDHLIWQLVLANKKEVPGDQLEFPVFWERAKYPSAAKRKIKGVSTRAEDIIESLQPYHAIPNADDHPLKILHDLDVIDKHRFIIVVAGELNIYGTTEFMFLPANQCNDVVTLRLTRMPTRHPDTEYQTSFDIAFDTFGSRKTETLIPALQQLCDFVAGAIEQFSPCFK